ncbi:uncharacterized protein LOC111000069 [Pieris rapae]|uniref:uncharacterized protein LOC111000069 n=1 Tax=Pieris rapae TaxID=64459 RepID=UPI001E27F16A|nr:uncharacterized protein LOC111000069 [Pieris rapae]
MCTTIQGETQGQKHKKFNKLVLKTVGNKKVFNKSIDYEDTDIENLLKVEVACHTRNVDFVLEVFKCKDILFVSRALRHATWLVEPEYAHIINPQYLNTQLFPYMMSEAWNKLLLLIRLNLRDPKRIQEFFNYLEKTDTNAAMKWFPKCSIQFILSRLQNNIYILPEQIVFRLFSHSFEAFKIYCDVFCKKSLKVHKALFLIKSNGEEFFDILDQLGTEHIPIFNKKYTKLAMKVCPHRLIFNFDHYQNHIDIQCFIKYMKLERFEEFQLKYSNNEKLISYFQKGRQKIQNLCEGKNILDALGSCDPNNKVNVINLLTRFKENCSQFSIDLIFKFINKLLSKCNVYQFNSVTWNLYIDVFKEIMNIKQYSENNKTIQSIMQSTIFYKIIHNEIISEEIMRKFKFDNSLKVDRKKLSKTEIQTVFDFLSKFALMQVVKTTQQNKVIWIENMFVLFKVWNRNMHEYPLFNIEVIKLIQELKNRSDYEMLKYLYYKNRFWRRYLLNENIVIEPNSSNTFINMLKHNPRLLVPFQKKRVIYPEKKLAAVFYRKLRTYWSDSLGQQYKDSFYTMLHQSPSLGLYILLSRIEFHHLIQCNAPTNKHNENVNKNTVQIHIARHMHKVYPKLSIKMALLYYKGIHMIHALSSINSILHGMSTYQMKESIESFDTWPELVQKLCIWVIFSQPRNDKQEFLLTIWQKTNYSSIRAEIFKKSMRSLCIYKDIEFKVKYNYIVMISEEWQFLQFLMDNLRKDESLIVDKFPYYFQRLPRMKTSDFCLKSYQIMKNFPSQYKIFPRKPLMHYFGGGFHLVDRDLLAVMVNDIITERLWITKMNYHHLDVVKSCLNTWNDDAEQMVSFRKIITPLFEKAYEKWDTKIVNCQLVKLNINNIVTLVNKQYQSYLDSDSNFSPSVLTLLLDSLEHNLSVKENYMMIRSLKLAVEYFKILSKANAIVKFDENTTFDKTSSSFAQLCINIFCDDVVVYGNSIWRLFYHALQDMLDRFDVKKHTQYKIYNSMLDLSTELTPELNYQVHVLIIELTLYKADNFMNYLLGFDSDDYENDDEGQEKLLNRIKTHHSNKVKAYHSKCVLSNVCDLYYKEFKYV